MKKSFFLFSILLIGVFVLNTFSSNACSAFMLKGKGYCTIGFNENWKTMPGIVVVNPRGIEKQSLSWNLLTSDIATSEKRIKWKSKYGSVSFNLLGIDMPCYGMNEKGLFIVELYLDKTFSAPDSTKASMFWAQWIQYQLDRYASVPELIANLNQAPVIDWWPTFPGSHFFVSDKKGNTAALELIDGVFRVSTAKTMPIPLLCNKPYQQELQSLNKYQAFGGAETFNIYSQKWNDRFEKAAHLLKSYDSRKMSPLTYSWNLLDSVKPGQWQFVADVLNNALYFRSNVGKAIKCLKLNQCDFSNKLSILYLDINSMLEGNVHSNLMPLSVSLNRNYVEQGFPVGYENAAFYKSLGYVNLKHAIDEYVRRTYRLKE